MNIKPSSQCKNYPLVVLLCILLLTGIVVAYLLCLGGTLLNSSEWNLFNSSDTSLETWEHGWPVTFRERVVINEASNRFVFWYGDGALVNRSLVIDLAVFALITGFFIWIFFHRIRLCWSKPRAAFAFSFRQLMILVTLICLVFAHYGMTLVESEKEQVSGAALESMGLEIEYHYIGPKWISRIAGSDPNIETLMGVKTVKMPYASSDDKVQATIVVLGTLHHVKWLSCKIPTLTDDRLSDFLKVPSLASIKGIYISDTQVTGTAFSNAMHLVNLSDFSANNSKINDQGIKHISSIGRIEWLSLDETRVTKSSVKYFLDMPYLTELSAFRTGIRPLMCVPLEERGVACSLSDSPDLLITTEQIMATLRKQWKEDDSSLKQQQILSEIEEQRLQELERYQSKELDDNQLLDIDGNLFLELREP